MSGGQAREGLVPVGSEVGWMRGSHDSWLVDRDRGSWRSLHPRVCHLAGPGERSRILGALLADGGSCGGPRSRWPPWFACAWDRGSSSTSRDRGSLRCRDLWHGRRFRRSLRRTPFPGGSVPRVEELRDRSHRWRDSWPRCGWLCRWQDSRVRPGGQLETRSPPHLVRSSAATNGGRLATADRTVGSMLGTSYGRPTRSGSSPRPRPTSSEGCIGTPRPARAGAREAALPGTTASIGRETP